MHARSWQLTVGTACCPCWLGRPPARLPPASPQCLDAFLAPADPAAAAETAPSSSGSGHAHTHWLYWLQLAADDFPGPPNGHNLTSLRRNLLHQMYLACPPAFHFPDPSAPNSAAEQALINLQQQEAALDAAVDGLLAVTSPQHRRLVRSTLAQLRGCFVRGSQQVFLNKVRAGGAVSVLVACGCGYCAVDALLCLRCDWHACTPPATQHAQRPQ